MSRSEYDVAGLGNAIVDLICPVEEAFLETWDIRKNGMTLVDEARAEALTQAGAGQEMSGGSGANTIAGVASFGGRSAYMGKVASDRLGGVFRREIHGDGVHFETPALDGGAATARSIIFVTPDGARSMNTFLGASVMFSPSDIDETVIRQSEILYLEGYLFDREAAKAAFVHAAEVARAAGRKVALTLSDNFCVDRHRESFRHLVRGHVDLLFANEDELKSLYETDDFNAAVELLRADSARAAVTRSEKGSVLVGDGDPVELPAEPVEQVVDTTGAGDQFAAGFLLGEARGLPLAVCGKLGHLAAAEVISHYGPRPARSYGELARQAGIEL